MRPRGPRRRVWIEHRNDNSPRPRCDDKRSARRRAPLVNARLERDVDVCTGGCLTREPQRKHFGVRFAALACARQRRRSHRRARPRQPTIGLGLVAKFAAHAAASAASINSSSRGRHGPAQLTGARLGGARVPSGRNARRASSSARNWPHAASTSSPRVSRIVVRMPRSAATNARAVATSGGPHGLPSMRFIGMTLTCARLRQAISRSACACST